jgi:hypothetical protein
MACRLAFDCGLNLDCSSSGLTAHEMEIRSMVLWACMNYDRCWSLFLGRPTAIKMCDITISRLTASFQGLGSSLPTVAVQDNLEFLIQESLLDLMDLVSGVTDIPRSRVLSTDYTMQLRIESMQRQLDFWNRRLPVPLQWSSMDISTAPSSFFILQ